jgi:hypothetical protein
MVRIQSKLRPGRIGKFGRTISDVRTAEATAEHAEMNLQKVAKITKPAFEIWTWK